jgi:hypothetical protein
LKEGDILKLSDAKELAFRAINEYSINGTPIPATNGNYLDIEKRMNGPANAAQMRIAQFVKIAKVYSISQNPIDNLLGYDSFKEVQHFPGTNLTYTGTGAKSFSIEVDGTCVISFDEYVSGVWTPLNGTYAADGVSVPAGIVGSISVTPTKFTNYRGLLTIASALNPVRITVTATYPIKSRYRAMFAYTYATAVAVPWYRAYIPYTLPADYWKFNKMMRTYDERQFTENKDYILTSDKKLYLNWYLEGEFTVHYWAYPTEITVDTLDTYEFEVSLECQALIPFFMGGQAIMPDNATIGTQLLNPYYQMESELTQDEPETEEQIELTYGW